MSHSGSQGPQWQLVLGTFALHVSAPSALEGPLEVAKSHDLCETYIPLYLFRACLVELDIAWNGLGDAGASAVATLLRAGTGLQRLDVSGNYFSWCAAAAVARRRR